MSNPNPISSNYPMPCLGNLVADSPNAGGPGGSVVITNSSNSNSNNTSASLVFKVANTLDISGTTYIGADSSNNINGNIYGNSTTWTSSSYTANMNTGFYSGSVNPIDYSDVRISAMIDNVGPPTGVGCYFYVSGNTLAPAKEAMRITSSGNVLLQGNLAVNNNLSVSSQINRTNVALTLGSAINNVKLAVYDEGTGAVNSLYGIGYNQSYRALTFVTAGTVNTSNIDMVLDLNGNLGLGTNFPAYLLDVSGAIRALGQITGQAFNATSDYRVKTNVMPLSGNSYSIDYLNPIKYTNINMNREDMGFLAHEVQEIFPFLVNGTKDGKDMQSLNYTGLIAVLVKEMKELKKQQEISMKENSIMKSRIDAIENEILKNK